MSTCQSLINSLNTFPQQECLSTLALGWLTYHRPRVAHSCSVGPIRSHGCCEASLHLDCPLSLPLCSFVRPSASSVSFPMDLAAASPPHVCSVLLYPCSSSYFQKRWSRVGSHFLSLEHRSCSRGSWLHWPREGGRRASGCSRASLLSAPSWIRLSVIARVWKTHVFQRCLCPPSSPSGTLGSHILHPPSQPSALHSG